MDVISFAARYSDWTLPARGFVSASHGSAREDCSALFLFAAYFLCGKCGRVCCTLCERRAPDDLFQGTARDAAAFDSSDSLDRALYICCASLYDAGGGDAAPRTLYGNMGGACTRCIHWAASGAADTAQYAAHAHDESAAPDGWSGGAALTAQTYSCACA